MIFERIIDDKDACISKAKNAVRRDEQSRKLVAEMVRDLKDALPAVRDLAEHLGKEDNVTGLMVKLGEICFNLGSNDNAKYFFEKAVSMDSHNCDALNNIGILHFQEREYDKAKNYFDKILKMDSENVDAIKNLGLVNLQQGNMAEARRLFMKAVKVNPGCREAIMNLNSLFGAAS